MNKPFLKLLLLSILISSIKICKAQNQQIIDSLTTELNKADEDTNKVIFFNKISRKLFGINPSQSILFSDSALNLSYSLNFKRGIAMSLGHKGIAQKQMGKYKLAAENYKLSLKVDKSIGNKKGESATLINLGRVASLQGNYTEAVNYYLTSLKIKEEINDQQGVGINAVNLGIVYYEQKNYKKALEYDRKASSIFKGLNDNYRGAIALGNAGLVYKELGDYEKAKIYNIKSLKCFQKIGIKSEIVRTYNNIGELFMLDVNNSDSAIFYFNNALTGFVELNYKEGIAVVKNNLAEIYRTKKQYKKAIKFSLDGLKIAKSISDKENTKQSYKILSDVYFNISQYKNSLIYYKLYNQIKDSLFNIENTNKITEIESKYNNQKLKTDNLKLEQEKQAEQNEKEKQRLISYAISAVLVLALILLGLIINRYRIKQKSNLILTQKNEQIQQLFSELHHRVKNNLQTVSSLLSLQSEQLQDVAAKKAINESENRLAAMSIIHQKLYQDEELTAINMKEYITELANHLVTSYDYKGTIKLAISENKIDVEQAIPIGLVVNELVSNSFEHAFKDVKNPELRIDFKTNENRKKINLVISDNGIGKKNDITKNEDSFGLKLVNMFVKRLSGTLKVTNDSGTNYQISFNL